MLVRKSAAGSASACVQALEPRRLLSAAAPVPTLSGGAYVGTVGTASNPAAADISILVTKESKSGKLTGTFTETSSGNVNVRNFTGSVNAKLKLVIHIKKQVQPHFVIHPETLTGTVTADANTLAGTTNSQGFRGIFSATRTPT